ncbi:MAG: hypothetical protein LC804_22610 [Acidobacteria bacterium]|nr:hypothetical protein [Acidobacteriota bacterium]
MSILSFVLASGLAAPVRAQEHIALESSFLFYGDNTEFRNPFREGETIFGAAIRLAARADVNAQVSLVLGVFANQRFGGDDAFEQVKPLAALAIRGRRSCFVMGTLPGPRPALADGPDRHGPHGLLPPLQRETLAFDRPYEAGLQWTFGGRRLRHDLWLNWQQVNTAQHRERFDTGIVAELRAIGPWHVPLQVHVVHQGGQLFGSGPVADSAAAATGIIVRNERPSRTVALEIYGVAGRHVPDRSAPGRSRNGAGMFARASAARRGWRGHLIVWRGDDFIKDEGDGNYLSVRRDGTRYRGIRDYAEGGLTRTLRLADAARVELSARLHRVERHYEYSYRVVGVASVDWWRR